MIFLIEMIHNTAGLVHFAEHHQQTDAFPPTPKKVYICSLELKIRTEITYSKPEVFLSSFILFSGTLLPLNHFLVAENSDRLKPFLDIN